MRSIWIADDDEIEQQLITDLMEEEPDLSAQLLSRRRLLRALLWGSIPDGLLIDEDIVREAVFDLLPGLDFVDRLVVLTGDLKPCQAELALTLPRARLLCRPIEPHRLVDALRWLSRYTDDEGWAAAEASPAWAAPPRSSSER